jgi:3-oxoacyl-(acyl-carrier-protein) synthase
LTTRAPDAHGVAAVLRRALARQSPIARPRSPPWSRAPTATPLDACEEAALGDVLRDAADRPILAPKQGLGECFGASGAFGVAIAAGVLAEPRPTPATAVLISSLCYSGSIAAMVVSRPLEER